MRRWMIFVLFLAIAARLIYAAAIYTPDLAAFESGDYILYRIGAEHIRTVGDFTNSLFLVRPPLFPLWIAFLNINPPLIIGANILMGALTAVLGMVFARQLHPDERIARGVGIILALEPTMVLYSAFLGPEPLANILLLIALIAVLRAMQPESGFGWSIAAGAALMGSAYVRPSTYLFWIAIGAWLLVKNRHQWRRVFAFVTVCAIGSAAWTLHNARVFNTPSFSTVAPYTMVYYHAASVERIATDQPIEQVYVSINERVAAYAGLEFETIDEGTRHSFLAAPPNVQDALNRTAWEIFSANPLITLATFPIGFARMYGLFPDVINAGTLLIAAFNVVFVLGALIGVVIALRQRRWMLLISTCLPIVYYTAGTLIVKSAGMDTRERSMLEPMIAVLFTAAVLSIWDRWRNRRTTPQHA